MPSATATATRMATDGKNAAETTATVSATKRSASIAASTRSRGKPVDDVAHRGRQKRGGKHRRNADRTDGAHTGKRERVHRGDRVPHPFRDGREQASRDERAQFGAPPHGFEGVDVFGHRWRSRAQLL